MPPARDWPTKAEHTRQDSIALWLDVQHLTRRIEAAAIEGDLETVVRLNAQTHHKSIKGQQLLQEARRTCIS